MWTCLWGGVHHAVVEVIYAPHIGLSSANDMCGSPKPEGWQHRLCPLCRVRIGVPEVNESTT